MAEEASNDRCNLLHLLHFHHNLASASAVPDVTKKNGSMLSCLYIISREKTDDFISNQIEFLTASHSVNNSSRSYCRARDDRSKICAACCYACMHCTKYYTALVLRRIGEASKFASFSFFASRLIDHLKLRTIF